MTKREREAVSRRFAVLEAKIAKKRDELREMLSDFESLIDSARQGDEELAIALSDLHVARRSFEGAVDTLSQYV